MSVYMHTVSAYMCVWCARVGIYIVIVVIITIIAVV